MGTTETETICTQKGRARNEHLDGDSRGGHSPNAGATPGRGRDNTSLATCHSRCSIYSASSWFLNTEVGWNRSRCDGERGCCGGGLSCLASLSALGVHPDRLLEQNEFHVVGASGGGGRARGSGGGKGGSSRGQCRGSGYDR